MRPKVKAGEAAYAAYKKGEKEKKNEKQSASSKLRPFRGFLQINIGSESLISKSSLRLPSGPAPIEFVVGNLCAACLTRGFYKPQLAWAEILPTRTKPPNYRPLTSSRHWVWDSNALQYGRCLPIQYRLATHPPEIRANYLQQIYDRLSME